jgi:hypothetical protein
MRLQVVDVKAREIKKGNGDVKGYEYTAVFTDHSELVIRKCSTRLHDKAFVLDEPLEFDSYKCNRGCFKGYEVESVFTIHKKHLDGVEGYDHYGSTKPSPCDPTNSNSWCFWSSPRF